MAHDVVEAAEALLDHPIPCLDKGFVRLVDYLGGDSRIVMEAGEETMSVFYILEIMNTARAPVNTTAPFVFDVDDELPPTLHLPEAVEAVWVPLSVLRDPAR